MKISDMNITHWHWPKWLKNNFLYNKSQLTDDSESEESWQDLHESERVEDLDEANVISSKWYDSGNGRLVLHKLFLDLDVEHLYVPSSTPGHGHLYLNVDLNPDQLEGLMATLVRFGIVSKGSLRQVRSRGASTLRLPWIKKELVEGTIHDPKQYPY